MAKTNFLNFKDSVNKFIPSDEGSFDLKTIAASTNGTNSVIKDTDDFVIITSDNANKGFKLDNLRVGKIVYVYVSAACKLFLSDGQTVNGGSSTKTFSDPVFLTIISLGSGVFYATSGTLI